MPVTVAVDTEGHSVHSTGPAEWRQRIVESQSRYNLTRRWRGSLVRTCSSPAIARIGSIKRAPQARTRSSSTSRMPLASRTKSGRAEAVAAWLHPDHPVVLRVNAVDTEWFRDDMASARDARRQRRHGAENRVSPIRSARGTPG